MARVGKLLQAVGKDFLIHLSFRLCVRSAIVEGAINRNIDDRRHDCDEKQFRMAPLRDVAAVKQRLLPGFRAVVGKQDTFVHGSIPPESMPESGVNRLRLSSVRRITSHLTAQDTPWVTISEPGLPPYLARAGRDQRAEPRPT